MRYGQECVGSCDAVTDLQFFVEQNCVAESYMSGGCYQSSAANISLVASSSICACQISGANGYYTDRSLGASSRTCSTTCDSYLLTIPSLMVCISPSVCKQKGWFQQGSDCVQTCASGEAIFDHPIRDICWITMLIAKRRESHD